MTAFSSYAFAATGGSAARNMPDRLAEIKNVKDFGATGDGSTDDWAAIQRAVNWTTAKDRGIIFFPPGTYKVTQSIVFDGKNPDTTTTSSGGSDVGELSITFMGVGDASIISGNFSDYIFKRSNGNTVSGTRAFRNLRISNVHATGGGILMMGFVGGSIENCKIGAYRCVTATSYNCLQMLNCNLASGTASGAWGVLGANGLAIINCDIQACAHGIRHYNIGLQVIGGRIEDCTVGIMLGQDIDGSSSASSAGVILGVSMENNITGIYANSAINFLIAGVSQGGANPAIQYGVRCVTLNSSLLTGVSMSNSSAFGVAAFDLTGTDGGLTIIGCTAAGGGGTQWSLPADAGSKMIITNSVGLVAADIVKLNSARKIVAGSTLAVTALAHDENTIYLATASGSVLTLPAATGSGTRVKVIVTVKPTSNAHIIKVANSSDTLTGSVNLLDNDANAQTAYAASGTDDTLTWNGTTTGGQVGDWVELEDIAANVWAICGQAVCPAGSNVADCFSATV